MQDRGALVSVASFHLSFTGHVNLGTTANRNVSLAQRRIIVWMASSEPASGEALNGSRIILADDDFLVREGLASLLERSDYKVVAQTGTADELLELVRQHEPNLVVVDIRMPPTHTTEGLEAARAIRQEAPDIGILVFSAHVEVEHAIELLATGRRIGYLLKSRLSHSQELI
jgi:CheY-like chemotaxis protein